MCCIAFQIKDSESATQETVQAIQNTLAALHKVTLWVLFSHRMGNYFHAMGFPGNFYGHSRVSLVPLNCDPVHQVVAKAYTPEVGRGAPPSNSLHHKPHTVKPL